MFLRPMWIRFEEQPIPPILIGVTANSGQPSHVIAPMVMHLKMVLDSDVSK